MERDYKKELSGFQAVWERVNAAKKQSGGSARLMPRKESKSRANRFAPRR